jgi:hypothetical protein
VSKRGAEFGPQGGPTAFTLQLPEPAAAETGTLPAAVSQADPAQAQQQAQMQQQRETAQHVAQPPFPATRGGFQNAPPLRGNPVQPVGRGGFQGQPGGVAPPRIATPSEQQNDGTLQQ